MNLLDDPAAIKAADPQDFLGIVESFPGQLSEGIGIGTATEGLPSLDGVTSVAVLGMGGSGIGGDVLSAVLRPNSPVPVLPVKGYELPAWVGPQTLVFACSYSGDTEETIATTEQAIEAGAKIVAVTSGGKLEEMASAVDGPIAKVPGGLPPRAAFGYLSAPLLVIWDRMAKEAHVPQAGAISDELGQAVELLKTRADSYHRGKAFEANQAKQMADSIKGRIPIIYGWDGLGEVAAYRWKCQLTECAKVPAWHNAFPELNHNEIVGWDQLQSLTGSSLVLIILRNLSTSGLGEHDRISKRIEITKPMISDHFSLVREVWSAGSGIGALYDLAYVGDFVATYLAIAQGVDPSPVEAIGHLKRELSKD